MKKTILINDTSFEGHHGCSFVVEAIAENMKKRGFNLVYSVPVGVNWENDPEALQILPTVDLIIVNGEGTLHHSQPRALEMVKITAFAKRHAIVCVLINSSYENNNDEIANYVKDFDLIYVRDNRSANELKQKNIYAKIVPDLSFYSPKEQQSPIASGISVSDSVFPEITAKLYHLSLSNGFNFIPILSPNSPIIEQQHVPYTVKFPKEYYENIRSSKRLITGRYHATSLALQAGIPFYVLPSNSHKIEDLLEDIGIGITRIISSDDLEISGFPPDFTDNEQKLISNYIDNARTAIKIMFDTITTITKQYYLNTDILKGYIKPNDRIFDCYCGVGYRSYQIATYYPVNSVIGFDPNSFEIDYAKDNSKTDNPVISYFCDTLQSGLKHIGDNSYDTGLLPLEKMKNADLTKILSHFERILTPGGRLIIFGNLQEAHLDTKRKDLLALSLKNNFILENTTSINNELLIIAMKSPLNHEITPYQEQVFSNIAESNHPSLNYKISYHNPWLQHAMVTYGLRMNNKKELLTLCETILANNNYSILEQAAALTVKAYQVLEDDNTIQNTIELILQEIDKTIDFLSSDEPEVIRWFVSLSFVKAKLWQKIGNFEQAILSFSVCHTKNIFSFGVHLATKVTEAFFHAGELSYTIGDLENCKKYWKNGLEFGRQLQQASLEDILINPEFPNLFDHGDGIREYTLAWDWIARCANGIHLLQRDGKLRDSSHANLQKSFLYQYEQVTQDILTLHKENEAYKNEIYQLRQDIIERTDDLVNTRTDLIDRTHRLENTITELEQIKSDLIDQAHQLEDTTTELEKYINAKLAINGKIIL